MVWKEAVPESQADMSELVRNNFDRNASHRQRCCCVSEIV
jgi:hypothetical protein